MTTPARVTQQDIDVQIARLKRELVELKRQRNDLSPIAAIPPEILGQILLLATTHPQDEKDFVDLQEESRTERFVKTLCHVSHTWRTISLGCPQLWAEIDVRAATDKRLVDFMLDHAHPLPISLHADAKSPLPTARRYGQLKAMNSVLRVLSGGVAFNKLALSGSLNFLTDVLQNARPATLRTLQIVVTNRRTLGYTAAGARIAQYPLFKRGAPELRALTVEGCAIPLTSPILLQSPHITSLSIHVQCDGHAAQVLDMLKAVRQVQRLNLDFRGPLIASHVSLYPVHLPDLSMIYLRGDSDSILTTFSNLRLSVQSLNLNFACAFRDQSHMPTYAALLFKAIAQARCPPANLRSIVPSGKSFSPEVLGLGGSHFAPDLDDVCHLRLMGNWMPDARVTPESDLTTVHATEILIMFLDQSTSSHIHWTEWSPLVLAEHPRDLQLTTGWSVDGLVMAGFLDGDLNYPDSFWEFLAQCPGIRILAIAPTHMFELIPNLFADDGGFPFPSLSRLELQGSILRDISSTGQKYESHLESLLEGLRNRRGLCREYGISKKWMLDDLWLDGYMDSLDPSLLRTAQAEGLIGRFSWVNQ